MKKVRNIKSTKAKLLSKETINILVAFHGSICLIKLFDSYLFYKQQETVAEFGKFIFHYRLPRKF